jgi:hypothetical protein
MNDYLTGKELIYDKDGEPIDLYDVQRVNLICFKCTNYLTEKGGILFSEPFESFSDNVDYVKKFHLCKKCFSEVLVFCGGVIID